MEKHILFRFGQDFKGALNQLHYKHAIPAEVSLGRLEIRRRATTLVLHKMWFDNWTSSPQPSVVSASGKVLFTEIQTGILRKTMQRDNEPHHHHHPPPPRSPSTSLFSFFSCWKATPPSLLAESGYKVNSWWTENKYTLQFAVATVKAAPPPLHSSHPVPQQGCPWTCVCVCVFLGKLLSQ